MEQQLPQVAAPSFTSFITDMKFATSYDKILSEEVTSIRSKDPFCSCPSKVWNIANNAVSSTNIGKKCYNCAVSAIPPPSL